MAFLWRFWNHCHGWTIDIRKWPDRCFHVTRVHQILSNQFLLVDFRMRETSRIHEPRLDHISRLILTKDLTFPREWIPYSIPIEMIINTADTTATAQVGVSFSDLSSPAAGAMADQSSTPYLRDLDLPSSRNLGNKNCFQVSQKDSGKKCTSLVLAWLIFVKRTNKQTITLPARTLFLHQANHSHRCWHVNSHH